MRKIKILVICFGVASIVMICMAFKMNTTEIYKGKGSVSFVSEAPLETIKASSNKLKGLINFSNNTFAFSFPVNSFEGFNSPLQKEHFNEHYLETNQYPNSIFSGKIIGLKPCDADCVLQVTAKGKFEIHGVTQIVSMLAELSYSKEKNTFKGKAKFSVLLDDYNINVPLILEAKISPVIDVVVNIDFEYETG